MNTASLKTFGQKARTLLNDGVSRKLAYWGFTPAGAITCELQPVVGGYIFRGEAYNGVSVLQKWNRLKEAISTEGFTEVAERAAYIWFNRLIAMQILGKNGYDLSLLEPASTDEATPRLLKRARNGNYEFLAPDETVRLKKVLANYEKEKEAFAILLIGWCHSHSLLKRVFGAIDDYTELLLPDDILSGGGFLELLNKGGYISEEDYRQVELIGWLYQFYISEKKDAIFKKFKEGKKAEATDIPAATQIFTPNWIVKYMVQNTVGKIWLEKNPASPIKVSLDYLVENADGNKAAEPIIDEVASLKLLDPAVGSGHILVEGFDLLYKMYLEEYYPAGEAVESILQNNLWGLDIDLRAVQLAQFAVLIKAAQYHPDVLKGKLLPNIYAMPAPVPFTKADVQLFLGKEGVAYGEPLQQALRVMLGAQNLGSIIQFEVSNEALTYILAKRNEWQGRNDLDIEEQALFTNLRPYLNVLEVLTSKYEAIAANPPYMGQKNMNGVLKAYVNKCYPGSYSDLFAVFMDACFQLLNERGRYGMINQQSWMFLSSYEDLRKDLLANQTIESMLHLGPRTFDELGGEVVQSTTFIIGKYFMEGSKGCYFRLTQYKSSDLKKYEFLSSKKKMFSFSQVDFLKITGQPIAYWISDTAVKSFILYPSIKQRMKAAVGMNTGDNNRFLKLWHEISYGQIDFFRRDITDASKSAKKWFPYNKGGGYKKWYGNIYYVINWKDDGKEVKDFAVMRNDGKHWSRYIQNLQYMFQEGISWSDIVSESFAARYTPPGFLFDVKGSSGFPLDKDNLLSLLALLCSKTCSYFIGAVNPTITIQVGDLSRIPVNDEILYCDKVKKLASQCIDITKRDWNYRETSYDFQTIPLIDVESSTIEESYDKWILTGNETFFQLHKNEENLNRIIISIYKLEDELQPDVALEDITILQDELDYEALKKLRPPYNGQVVPIKKEVPIQQLISYAIGCFMGRYRLDKPGLHVAHPAPTEAELRPYSYTSPSTTKNRLFTIDEDGIIPLMGGRGAFPDDAANKLREFLHLVWGEKALTQNINFIQEALNSNLDEWLVKKFWPYHVRTYSKKPIYWLFSSKRGAFQALVYMHRMNRFTAEKLRDKYLIKHIQYLGQEIERMEKAGAASSRTEARKLDVLRAALAECNEYDLVLKQVATEQIEFDLDDGVTKNYTLFKSVVAPIK